MAAKTPTLYRESMGSLTLHICSFSDIDDGDTWASGINGIMTVIGQQTSDPIAESDDALSVSVTNFATGAMTFYTGQSNRAVDLIVLSKS